MNYLTLYHGSFNKTKVKIKNGSLFIGCTRSANRYDGICATQDKEIAKRYGEYLHSYRIPIKEIANNQDLVGDKAVEVIKKELKIDDDTLAKQITFAVAYQHNIHEILPHLIPRFRGEYFGDENEYDSEIWRLRGRIADTLGFRAVSYVDDMRFVNYLVVR